jgi:predicted transcriptional regulator
MIDMTHAGYSQAEIADAVGCSQSAVSKRLTRMMITGGKTQRQHGYQRSASA